MAQVTEHVSDNPLHQKGAEHIKDQVFDGRQTATTDAHPNPPPVAPAQPPASNPGADDATRAVGQDAAGGVNAHDSSTRDDTEDKNIPDHDTSGGQEHKPLQHEETSSKSKGSSMENRDAIPTAGGQRLGEKHWGESGFVPDLPPKRESEAGIASKDGQPTGETATNTAANTGGATGGPGHEASGGEEKQKFTDKIKDKLNMGKKE